LRRSPRTRAAPEGLSGDLLRAHLAQGSAFLLLDGLDEVPVSEPRGGLTLDSRALLLSGLLLPRSNGRAAFYHLSFQEFLAAECIARTSDDRAALAQVLRDRGKVPEQRPTLLFLFAAEVFNYRDAQWGLTLLGRLATDLTRERVAANPALLVAEALALIPGIEALVIGVQAPFQYIAGQIQHALRCPVPGEDTHGTGMAGPGVAEVGTLRVRRLVAPGVAPPLRPAGGVLAYRDRKAGDAEGAQEHLVDRGLVVVRFGVVVLGLLVPILCAHPEAPPGSSTQRSGWAQSRRGSPARARRASAAAMRSGRGMAGACCGSKTARVASRMRA
jgi:hypothetical protein